MDETQAQVIRAQWHWAQAQEATEEALGHLHLGKAKLARGALEHAFYLVNRGIQEAVLVAKGAPLPELPEYNQAEWVTRMSAGTKPIICYECSAHGDPDMVADHWHLDVDNDWHCGNCWPTSTYNPDVARCYNCECVVDSNDAPRDNDGDAYCQECWDTSLHNPDNAQCHDCGEITCRDDMHSREASFGTMWSCPSCCEVCQHYADPDTEYGLAHGAFPDHDSRVADWAENEHLARDTSEAYDMHVTWSYWHNHTSDDVLDVAHAENVRLDSIQWRDHDAIRALAHNLNREWDEWHSYSAEQVFASAWTENSRRTEDVARAKEIAESWRQNYPGPDMASQYGWGSLVDYAYGHNKSDQQYPTSYYNDPGWNQPEYDKAVFIVEQTS